MFNLKKIVSAVIAGAMILSTLPMAYATTNVFLDEDFAEEMTINGSSTPFAYGDSTSHVFYDAENKNIYTKNNFGNGGKDDTRSFVKYTEVSGINEKFYVETDFKIPTIESGVEYNPIAFVLPGNVSLNQIRKTVYVKGEADGDNVVGKVYAADPTPSTTSEGADDYFNKSAVKVTDANGDDLIIEAGATYRIRISVDMDDDAETFIKYSYKISKASEDLAQGGPHIFGLHMKSGYSAPKYDSTEISYVAFGAIANSANYDLTMVLDNMYGEYVPTQATVTADATSNIAVEGPVELVFDRAVNEDTLDNITMVATAAPEVDVPVTCELAADGKTVSVYPNADLASNTEYKITIPETVLDEYGFAVEEDVVTFTTETIIVNENLIVDESFNREATLGTTFVKGASTSHVHYDATNKNIYTKNNYNTGGNDTLSYVKYTGETNINKAFYVETDFQIPTIDANAIYYPVLFDVHGNAALNNLRKTVYVKGETVGESVVGKVYAAAPSPSNTSQNSDYSDNSAVKVTAADGSDLVITAGQTYRIRISVDMDADASTFTYYSYVISKASEELAQGGPHIFGLHVNPGYANPKYDATEIKNICFGGINKSTNYDLKVVLDNVYGEYVTTKATVSATATSDISVEGPVELVFDRKVNKASLKNITLVATAAPEVDVPVTCELAADGKTVSVYPNADLASNTEYKITVPATVLDEYGIGVVADEVTFTTETIIVNENEFLNETFTQAMTFGGSTKPFAYGDSTSQVFYDAENKNIYTKNNFGTGGKDDTRSYVRYTDVSGFNSAFYVETDFTIPTIDAGARYFPVLFSVSGKTSFNNARSTVYVKGVADGDNVVGKVYAANPTPSTTSEGADDYFNDSAVEVTKANGAPLTIEAGETYRIRIYMDVDADASTFTKYSYVISKASEELAKGGPHIFGLHTNSGYSAPIYNSTAIDYVGFGGIGESANAELKVVLDNMYGEYLPEGVPPMTPEQPPVDPEEPDVNENLILDEDFAEAITFSSSGTPFALGQSISQVFYNEEAQNIYTKNNYGNGGAQYDAASFVRYTEVTNIDKDFYVETDFTIPTIESGALYYPVLFTIAETTNLNNSRKTVYIKGEADGENVVGKVYAAAPTPSTTSDHAEAWFENTSVKVTNADGSDLVITAGETYRIRIYMEVDDDASTFTKYSYVISKAEEELAKGGAYIFGLHTTSGMSAPIYNSTAIANIAFGGIANTANYDAKMVLDNMYGEYLPEGVPPIVPEQPPVDPEEPPVDPEEPDVNENLIVDEDFAEAITFSSSSTPFAYGESTAQASYDAEAQNIYTKNNYGPGGAAYDARSFVKYTDVTNINKDFYVETDFTIPTIESGALYYPVLFTIDGTTNLNTTRKTVYIKGEADGENVVGKVYAAAPNPSTTSDHAEAWHENTSVKVTNADGSDLVITAGETYRIRIYMEVDDDASTFTKYSYIISKAEEELAKGGAYIFGLHTTGGMSAPIYNSTAIANIAFGGIANTTNTDAKMVLDNIYGEYLPEGVPPIVPEQPPVDPEDPEDPVAPTGGFLNETFADALAFSSSSTPFALGESTSQVFYDEENKNIYTKNNFGTGGSNDTRSYVRYTGVSNISRAFYVETDFTIPTIDAGARYFPVLFSVGGKTSFNTARSTVYVKGVADGENVVGNVYAANPTPSTTSEGADDYYNDSAEKITDANGNPLVIEAGVTYRIRITVDIDDDADTFTYYSYVISKASEELAKGGPHIFGLHTNSGYSAPIYNSTAIDYIGFGGIGESANADLKVVLDNMYGEYLPVPTYTTSIETDSTNVSVDEIFVVTFDQAMNEDSLNDIIVYEGDPSERVVYQSTKTLDAETGKIATITPVKPFRYGRKYTVVIGSKVCNNDGIKVQSSQVAFTTATMPIDGVTIGTPSITGSVVANGNVTGSVVFTKNNFDSTEDLTFMAVAYDANNTKVGIGYTEANFAESNTVTLNFGFAIPSTAVGTGEIKLFVWDSFKTMKPVSEDQSIDF